jgi:hypothetical protein
MKKVKIKDFVFEIDIEKTKKAHEKRKPASLECPCGDCKEFNEKLRETFFSEGLKKTLMKFGLDYRKEDYLANYARKVWQVAYYVTGKMTKKGKQDFLQLTPPVKMSFAYENLPHNFLPDGLPPPYFEITLWIDNQSL